MEAYVAVVSIGIVLSCVSRARFLRDVLVATILWRLIRRSAFDETQRFEICSRLASALASREQPAADESAASSPPPAHEAFPAPGVGAELMRRLMRLVS